jgi:Uma2 family endonuclease
MSTTAPLSQPLTAEQFLRTDQHVFGDAWRYELVEGRIVAHAAPSPDHGAILSALSAALSRRLEERVDGCRSEIGSGAAPRQQQRPTARIPDAMIRCHELPRVTFDVVSPFELTAWRAGDRRRQQLQDVAGVQEIVEIYQDEAAIHIYRRQDDGNWVFDAVSGLDAVLLLRSVQLEIPVSEIYRSVALAPDADG